MRGRERESERGSETGREERDSAREKGLRGLEINSTTQGEKERNKWKVETTISIIS